MAVHRTPLAQARGLGAAKHGVRHWIGQRVSAIALVPLVIWAVWAGLTLARADYLSAVAFVQAPLNAVLLSLLAVAAYWHMQTGMQVVIEDYFSTPLSRAGLLLINLFVCVGIGALAVFSILKVALGGA